MECCIDDILDVFPVKRFDVVGGSSSDEEGEHTLENIMLCSFAHHACRPLLQGFVYEEEQCKVALTFRFAFDVIFLCQE